MAQSLFGVCCELSRVRMRSSETAFLPYGPSEQPSAGTTSQWQEIHFAKASKRSEFSRAVKSDTFQKDIVLSFCDTWQREEAHSDPAIFKNSAHRAPQG